MKKFTPILLLTISLLIFSGCGSKNYNVGGLKMPSFSEKRLDPNLKTVKELKVKTSMSKVALEWQPIKDKHIAGYRIFRGDNQNGYKLIKTIKDRYQSHFVDKNLNPGIKYIYKVSAYTDDGRVSNVSTARTARTENKLTTPILIKASKGYPNRVKIIWRLHPDKITRAYIVERKAKGADWEKVSTLSDRLTVEYIDKDVKPAQIYSYRIRAKSYENIISKPSNEVQGYSKKLPNTITWVKATDNRARLINVIWKDTNNPKNISGYNIYSSPLKNSMFSLAGTSKTTKFTDKFNSDGNKRYYKITAVDKDGLESLKSETAATLGATVGASRGPVIELATVRENTIYLKWNDPDKKARKFTIVKKYWDGWRSKKVKIIDFKSTKFTDKKIKPDTKYTYYIISIDKHGIESMPSKEVILSINPK